MNNKLVYPEARVKSTDLYGLCKLYRDKKASVKQVKLLESATDIDYLLDIYKDDEARVFMADFIGMYWALDTQLRTKVDINARNFRMRDVYANYYQIETQPADGAGEAYDPATYATLLPKVDAYVDQNWNPNTRLKSSYTLRDYKPSLRFSPDAIIDMIDTERAKVKEGK